MKTVPEVRTSPRVEALADMVGPVAAEVIQTPTGFGALLLEGPDVGRWWALDGHWEVGQELRVRYAPADQFAQAVGRPD